MTNGKSRLIGFIKKLPDHLSYEELIHAVVRHDMKEKGIPEPPPEFFEKFSEYKRTQMS